MDPIKVVVSADGRVRAGLVVAGRAVDFQSVPLPGVTVAALEARGLHSLILDLSQATYVNSSGLGWIVRFADELRTRGGGLVLVGLQDRTRIVIEMLGLGAFFGVAEDLDAAFAQLAEPPPEQPPPGERRGPVYGAPPPRG